MKTLAIDVTFLFDQYYRRGIGRYGREIVSRLCERTARKQDIQLVLLGFGNRTDTLNLLECSDAEAIKNCSLIKVEQLDSPHLSSPIYNLYYFFFKLQPALRRLQPDAFFAAHFDRGIATNFPTVVTVHDAIPLINKSYSHRGRLINFLKGIYFKYVWRKINAAKLVITDSEVSASDIVRLSQVPRERIAVIPLGVSEIFRSALEDDQALAKFNLVETKYLIYDAGLEGNKNTPALLRLFAEIRKTLDVMLVLTGSDFKDGAPANAGAHKFLSQAQQLNVAEFILGTGRVSELELVTLFKHAVAYVNMSAYEGFGFGPLQAMSVGTPAIISDNAAFVEVSGPAALVVTETTEIKDVIETITNAQMRDDLIARGLLHAAKFTWTTTFTLTWDVIDKVIHDT